MFPLRKKKDKEEKEEIEIKDKPEKKSKRKKKVEPEKPWKGIERLVVFILLVLLPLLSLTFFAKSKNQSTALSKEKVLGEMVSAPHDTVELKNELTNETQNLSGTY